MAATFFCPSCQTKLKSKLNGRKIRCHVCKFPVTVPEEPSAWGNIQQISPETSKYIEQNKPMQLSKKAALDRGGRRLVFALASACVILLVVTVLVAISMPSKIGVRMESVKATKASVPQESKAPPAIAREVDPAENTKEFEAAKKRNADWLKQSPKPPEVKTPKQDTKWVLEASFELLGAEKDRLRRMEEYAYRVGRFNEAEYQIAAKAALTIQKSVGVENIEQIHNYSADFLELASKVAPLMILHRQREALMRSSNYPLLVKNGAAELRLPWEQRRSLYEEFARIVGEDRPWSLGVFFDNLNKTEMENLINGIRLADKQGFGAINKEQRLLILKAGALDYVRKQIEAAKSSR